MTDTRRFKAMMTLKGYTLERLAKELGLSVATLSYKINNIRQFKLNEIRAVQTIWNLTPEERDAIFFADEVDK